MIGLGWLLLGVFVVILVIPWWLGWLLDLWVPPNGRGKGKKEGWDGEHAGV